MYILYGFGAGTFVLETENQAYYKARPPTSNSKKHGPLNTFAGKYCKAPELPELEFLNNLWGLGTE
jgi:hypothetical protein